MVYRDFTLAEKIVEAVGTDPGAGTGLSLQHLRGQSPRHLTRGFVRV